MKFEICAATNVGCIRKNNEDGFYVNGLGKSNSDDCFFYEKTKAPILAFVADGVGSTQVGEEATRLCIDTAYTEPMPNDDNDLIGLIDKMNKKVCSLKGSLDTACTIAGIFLGEDNLYWFNLGDSRVYSISQGFLNQLSVDDTLSGLSGDIAERKEPLIQYIGKSTAIPHIKETSNISTFLICTDGLTDLVSIDEIECLFKKEQNICVLVNKLIYCAKQKGGSDNITIIVINPLKEGKENG